MDGKNEITENVQEEITQKAASAESYFDNGRQEEVKELIAALNGVISAFEEKIKRFDEIYIKNPEKGENLPEKDGISKGDVVIDEKAKEAIIGEYLDSVLKRRVPLMSGSGTGVAAGRRTPKTIKEAGRLALGYLKDGNR